jgi:hypothetical protein
MSWLIIGFVIVAALALRRDFENETNKLAARLKSIEAALERMHNKLLISGTNTARAARALDCKQETIEEQWLRENYTPPA